MMRGCLRWTDKMAERNKIERGLITFIYLYIYIYFYFSSFRISIQVSKKSNRFKRSCLSKGGVGLDLGIGTGGASDENYYGYRQKGGLSCNKKR